MRMTVFKKIRSRKGASITFALLAFLVCAVIGSVVLSAAIASSGRVSGLAEMDQRYYAVTSAAQLFSDALDRQNFTIERKLTQNDYYTQNFSKDSEGKLQAGTKSGPLAPTSEYASAYPYKTYTNSMAVNRMKEDGIQKVETDTFQLIDGTSAAQGFLAEAALYYVLQGKTAAADLADAWNYTPGFARDWDFTVKASTGSGDDSAEITSLRVDVEAKMKADGTIDLKFSNREGKDDTLFAVTLTLKASIRDNSASPNVSEESHVFTTQASDAEGNEIDGSYTEDTIVTTTTTKTTEITWTVTEIKKVAA